MKEWWMPAGKGQLQRGWTASGAGVFCEGALMS